jgi:hypothetical protein
MTSKEQLLSDIDAFLEATGMSRTRFGQQAVGDTTIIRRLRAGATCSLDMADRMRAFMRTHRQPEAA